MIFILLQILRGVAAAMVVSHHYVASQVEREHEVRQWVEDMGGSGVDIFFVISGFIMMITQSDPAKAVSAKDFLWRRLVRIAPLYWALTVLAFLLALLAGNAVNSDFSLQKALASMLFLPFGSGIDMETNAHTAYVIPMSWTLTYEWYFYLVFAVTLAFGLQPLARLGVMAIWFAASVAIGLLLQPASLILQMASNPIVFEFLLGCLIAILYRKGYRLSGLQASVLAIIAAVLLGNIFHQSAFERILLWGIPAFMLIAAASLYQAGRLDFAVLSPLVRLGDISYSLYLSHFFCLALFVRLQDRLPYLDKGFSPLSLALFMLLVLLVAEICYRCIEEPARKYFGRRRHRLGQPLKT
jgi:exopolysaccharide production protein ExoZ